MHARIDTPRASTQEWATLRVMASRPKRENWSDSPPQTWAEREAYRFSRVLQELRRGRSAQWLSDETHKLGHRVSRAVISDLETGRRRYITTSELLVLAAALDTSPVTLMYPGPYQDQVEILPGLDGTQFDAAQWFSGEGTRGFTPEPSTSRGRWLFHVQQLRQWRRLETLEDRRRFLASEEDADRDQIAFYDEQIRELRVELQNGGTNA